MTDVDEDQWLYGGNEDEAAGDKLDIKEEAPTEDVVAVKPEEGEILSSLSADATPFTSQAADPPGENGVEATTVDDDDSDSDDDVQVTIRDIKTAPVNLNIKPTTPYSRHSTTTTSSKSATTKGIDVETEGTANGIPLFDFDLEGLQDKPWLKPGADITDYFNYGFSEDSWKLYCEKQKVLRSHNRTGGGLSVVMGAMDHAIYGQKQFQPKPYYQKPQHPEMGILRVEGRRRQDDIDGMELIKQLTEATRQQEAAAAAAAATGSSETNEPGRVPTAYPPPNVPRIPGGVPNLPPPGFIDMSVPPPNMITSVPPPGVPPPATYYPPHVPGMPPTGPPPVDSSNMPPGFEYYLQQGPETVFNPPQFTNAPPPGYENFGADDGSKKSQQPSSDREETSSSSRERKRSRERSRSPERTREKSSRRSERPDREPDTSDRHRSSRSGHRAKDESESDSENSHRRKKRSKRSQDSREKSSKDRNVKSSDNQD